MIVHQQETGCRSPDLSAVAQRKIVAVQNQPLRCTPGTELDGLGGIRPAADIGGNPTYFKTFGEEAIAHRRTSERKSKDYTPTIISPNLRQCCATHYMPDADLSTCVGADE
jgi:hypothetical protein